MNPTKNNTSVLSHSELSNSAKKNIEIRSIIVSRKFKFLKYIDSQEFIQTNLHICYNISDD